MKTFFTLLTFTLLSLNIFGQFQYDIVISNDVSNKETMTNIFSDYNTNHKYINNDTIHFKSVQKIDSIEISLKCDNLGYSLDYFNYIKLISLNSLKNGSGNQDCGDATMVCNDSAFSGNSSGYGNQELNNFNSGCLDIEHESSWYYINVGTSGTLEMTVSPQSAGWFGDDYDFAIWGPYTEATANANCPPIESPIRCSWAAGNNDTGMRPGETTFLGNPQTSEGALFGNGWVAPLNVTDGEVYIMVIDNYSESNDPFGLQWGGDAELECEEVSLPIELINFEPIYKDGVVILNWETYSETNNDYFNIDRSFDGYNFETIYTIDGQGNKSTKTTYEQIDRLNYNGIVYYRLSQTDFDGGKEIFPPKTVVVNNDKSIVKVVDLLGREVRLSSSSIKVIIYSDGSSKYVK